MNSLNFLVIIISIILVAAIVGLILILKKHNVSKIKIVLITFVVTILIIFSCIMLLYFDYARTISSQKVNLEQLNTIAEEQVKTYDLDKIKFSASRSGTLYVSVYSDNLLDEQIQNEICDTYKSALNNQTLKNLILNKYYNNSEHSTLFLTVEFFNDKEQYSIYSLD